MKAQQLLLFCSLLFGTQEHVIHAQQQINERGPVAYQVIANYRNPDSDKAELHQFISLSSASIHKMDDVYKIFAHEMSLPSYFGKNLDALYDVLIYQRSPLIIEFENALEIREAIGERQWLKLLEVFKDAQQINPENIKYYVNEN